MLVNLKSCSVDSTLDERALQSVLACLSHATIATFRDPADASVDASERLSLAEKKKKT